MMGKRQASAHRSSQPRRGDYKNGNEVCLIKDRAWEGCCVPLDTVMERRPSGGNYRAQIQLQKRREPSEELGQEESIQREEQLQRQEDRTWQSLGERLNGLIQSMDSGLSLSALPITWGYKIPAGQSHSPKCYLLSLKLF